MCHRRVHNHWLRHATPYHYRHHAELPRWVNTCDERYRGISKWLLVLFCRECISFRLPSSSSFHNMGCICSTDPFRWLRGYFKINLIIITKSETSTFPIVFICSVVVCLRWLYHNMMSVASYRSRESLAFVSYCAIYVVRKWLSILRPELYFHITPSHYHHYVDFSQSIEHIK